MIVSIFEREINDKKSLNEKPAYLVCLTLI